MDSVSVVIDCAILDASWLLELYQVPGHSREDRLDEVTAEAGDRSLDDLFLTVPVIFEFANHLVRVKDGNRRRQLIERYCTSLTESLNDDGPWTVVADTGEGILLRAETLIELAERFVRDSGTGDSLADISVIDLVGRLRQRGRKVLVLSFDPKLAAYSG